MKLRFSGFTVFQVLVAICCTLVLATVIWWVMGHGPSEKAAENIQAKPSLHPTANNSASQKSSDGNTEVLKTQGQTTREELIAKYFSSQNLGEYVELAKRHPELGGIYLARMAVSRCVNLQKQWSGARQSDSLSNAQSTARALLQSRCEGITQLAAGFSSPLEMIEDLDRFGAERDPLRTAQKRLTMSTNDSSIDRKAEVTTLLRKGGGALMLPDQLSELSGARTVPYLNGKPYGGGDENAFVAAWLAYVFEKSISASKDGLGGVDVLQYCLETGICDGAPIDRAVRNLSPSSAKHATAVYEALKQALDRADTDAFKKPAAHG